MTQPLKLISGKWTLGGKPYQDLSDNDRDMFNCILGAIKDKSINEMPVEFIIVTA